MLQNNLLIRTKRFSLAVLELVDKMPNSISGRILANQLGRSGTSVGANYRAVCRGKSKADFINKLGIVEEEVDESAFWLELILARNMVDIKLAEPLLQEAQELTAIMAASRITARNGQ